VAQCVMADLRVNVAAVNAVKRTRTSCERRNRQYKRYFNPDLAHLYMCTSTSAFSLTSNTTSTFDRIIKPYSSPSTHTRFHLPAFHTSATPSQHTLSTSRVAHPLAIPWRTTVAPGPEGFARCRSTKRCALPFVQDFLCGRLTTVFLVHPGRPRHLDHEGHGEEIEGSGRSSPTSRFARLLAESGMPRSSKRATGL